MKKRIVKFTMGRIVNLQWFYSDFTMRNFAKITGINWPPSKQFKPNKCLYQFVSGKKKGLACDKKCFNKYCPSHEKIMNKRAAKKSYNEKKKLNEEFANLPLANVIIDLTTQAYHNTCAYVFKRGKNKGNRCKCKKKFNNSSQSVTER